jgi:hypothetical protein
MSTLLNETQVEELQGFEFDEYMSEYYQSNWESVIETDEDDWLFVE